MKIFEINHKRDMFLVKKLVIVPALALPLLLLIFVLSNFLTGSAGAQDAEYQANQLWKRIQGANYRSNWHLFPGKGKLYIGTEPHGMLLTTYVNNSAEEGIKSKARELSKGSILIKENYMPDKTLAAITVMEKTGEGKNDWFWVKYNPDGTVATMETEKDGKKMQTPVAGGKQTMCATCHAASTGGIHNIMTPSGSN